MRGREEGCHLSIKEKGFLRVINKEEGLVIKNKIKQKTGDCHVE